MEEVRGGTLTSSLSLRNEHPTFNPLLVCHLISIELIVTTLPDSHI